MAKYVVGKVDDVPEGEHMVVEVNGRSVGVFNMGGEFYGLLNRCPHQGGPMCEGRLVGLLEADGPGRIRFTKEHKLLACPWHGWEFDVKTGQSYCDPARTRLRRYPVVVEHGDIVATELAEEAKTDTHLVQGEVTTETSTPHGSVLVKGPYMAETVEVSIEDDYVVVTMRNEAARGSTSGQ
jgi:3-phenylpropionate/trans-cinnamate dioxygenase ferredoxin subunit